jgi:hypothetical protein
MNGPHLMLLAAGCVGPMMWWQLHRAGLHWTACFSWLSTPAGMGCLAGILSLQALGVILKKQLHRRMPVLPGALRNPYVQIGLVGVYLAALACVSRGGFHAPRILLPTGLVLLALGTALSRNNRPAERASRFEELLKNFDHNRKNI